MVTTKYDFIDLNPSKTSDVVPKLSGDAKNTDQLLSSQIRGLVDSYRKGNEIATFSPEDQKTIITYLRQCSDIINHIFPDAIDETKRDVSNNILLLPTPEFATIYHDEIGTSITKQNKPSKLVSNLFDIMAIKGFRNLQGDFAFIHTTDYSGIEPSRMTIEQAFIVGRHEQIHLKVKSVIKTEENITKRLTGCKITIMQDGQVVGQEHEMMYEAQTNCLSYVSSVDKYKSFAEIYANVLSSQKYNNVLSDEDISGVRALTRILDFAFPDFKEGLAVLGETYFRSEGDMFFSKLREKIVEKGGEKTVLLFDTFVEASKLGDKNKMLVTADNLVTQR